MRGLEQYHTPPADCGAELAPPFCTSTSQIAFDLKSGVIEAIKRAFLDALPVRDAMLSFIYPVITLSSIVIVVILSLTCI
jgi:hypothetical protein